MGSFVKRYKGSYFAYVLAYVGLFFSMAVFSSILSVYLTGIGKSASEVSLIASASSIFSVVTVPLAGYAADRVRSSKAFSAALLLSGRKVVVMANKLGKAATAAFCSVST